MVRTPRNPPRRNGHAETLGQRLARIRKERGFTQVELAQKVGTIQAVISDYERGRVRPHAAIIGQVSQALGVTADELLGIAAASPQAASSHGVSRRILRRMQVLEQLPAHDQKAILKFIDALAAQHAGKRVG
jgi:transcriptional regulator with XRE-family HTH domain